jgi:hypothetical protein
MNIKKAHVKLLLGKIRVFLDAQPAAARKSKKFVEAKKALDRLQSLFTDKKSELLLVACRKDRFVIPPGE